MLVTFGLLKTLPAKVLKTLCALDLSTAAAQKGYPDATFRVWTKFGTLFNVNFVESQFNFPIFTINFFHLLLEFV